MTYHNASLPCEDPGEVDVREHGRRVLRREEEEENDYGESSSSTSTKSIWTTSSWFQPTSSAAHYSSHHHREGAVEDVSPYHSNKDRNEPVLANCARGPENASNVGGLVHNRFTEKRSQRNPLHPVEAKSVNLFENKMSSGMRSIYSKGNGRNSANNGNRSSNSDAAMTTTTTSSPFNSHSAVGNKCLDAFEFAKREHAEKRREHIRAKFTFDFERNKWTLNERPLESEDMSTGIGEEGDAITTSTTTTTIDAKNVNTNMTIQVEEEMNAAQMLHIQTTRELRLKKHLPRHESALLSAAKKASSSSSPVAAKANGDSQSAKKKKTILREEKKAVREDDDDKGANVLQTDWSRFVLSSGQVVWVDTTNANILEDYAAAKTWMETQEHECESESIRVCFFSATKERKGFIDHDAPGPIVDRETFLVFKNDLKSSIEQHERQKQETAAAAAAGTTDAMEVDGQRQHGLIADKLKEAAKTTQPKTKEEEILREKLKDAIKIKYAQADEIRALRERVEELENKLLSRA